MSRKICRVVHHAILRRVVASRHCHMIQAERPGGRARAGPTKGAEWMFPSSLTRGAVGNDPGARTNT